METEARIVIDCPVCFRTIWAGSTCHHGRIPPPSTDEPPKPEALLGGVQPSPRTRNKYKGK